MRVSGRRPESGWFNYSTTILFHLYLANKIIPTLQYNKIIQIVPYYKIIPSVQ